MFDPNTFTIPVVSKKQQLLDKHGVYEKWLNTDDGRVIILVKSPDATRKELLAKKDVSPEQATTAAVMLGSYEMYRSNPDEKFRDFMLRLGWIYESNGKYEIA